jgi:cell division protein DivIC
LVKKLPKLSSTRVVLLVTAVVVGYFLVTGATSALRSHHLSERQDNLRAEIGALQTRYSRLEALRDYLGSDEYIEAVAREQLGLVRRGETSIVVIPTLPQPTPESGADEHEPLWWETLIR